MAKISYDKIHQYMNDFLVKSAENELDLKYCIDLWNSEEIKNNLKFGDFCKNNKDENKPKKNTSSYLFFCSENRRSVRKELGDGPKATEITIELARRWNVLKNSSDENSIQEFKRYLQLGKEDKERYNKEMVEYKNKLSNNTMSNSVCTRSAYMFFYEENKEKVQSNHPKNTSKKIIREEISKLWKELKNNPDRIDELIYYKNKSLNT